MPTIFTFSQKKEWVEAATQEAMVSIGGDPFSLALSGGSTPESVYQILAQQLSKKKNLRLRVFQADERFVPQNDSHSNALLIKKSFLGFLSPEIFVETFFFDTTIPPSESAKNYELLLKGKLPLDVCILGIGNDGHTASLFPKSPALQEKKALVLQTEAKNYPIPIRMSLSFPAILSSKKILLLLKGKEKKGVLDEFLSGTLPPQDFPAKYLLPHKNINIFFLEKE